MSDKQTKTALVKPGTEIPANFQINQMLLNVQNDTNMSSFQRRKLLKQAFMALFQQRQAEFTAALDIQKERLGRGRNLISKQLETQEKTVEMHIREEYIKTMNSLGMRVEMAQLEFVREFGERLKKFTEDLKKRDIALHQKKMIKEMVDKSFERVCDQLSRLTEKMLEEARAE